MDIRTRNVLSLSNMWRMAVIWSFFAVWSYLQLLVRRIFGREKSLAPCLPNMHLRPACIVTGASSGIGKATAEALACEGYFVILAGPSSLNLSKAVTEIECRHQGVALKAMELDLASVSSIIKFAIAVEELVEAPNAPTSLQLLVNNAGILAASRRLTSEGCDYMIASNYLGHFMLTQLLLSLLRRSSNPARIVNVASFTHRCVKRLQVNLECLAKGEMHKLGDSREDSELYSIAHIYEESKLSMVMFTYELHRRLYISDPLSQISVIAADPGIVQTGIFREFPSWLSHMAIAFLRLVRLMQLPNDGCQSVIDAALAPAEMSGRYFFGGNGRTLTSSSLSYDQEAARNLWETSFALHIATISRQTSIIQKK